MPIDAIPLLRKGHEYEVDRLVRRFRVIGRERGITEAAKRESVKAVKPFSTETPKSGFGRLYRKRFHTLHAFTDYTDRRTA